VSNGVRIDLTSLKKHIPSNINIAGTKVIISYKGQPPTCFGCNEVDHLYIDCPRRKSRDVQRPQGTQLSWADIVVQETPNFLLGPVQHRPMNTTDVSRGSDRDVPSTQPREKERPTVKQATTTIFTFATKQHAAVGTESMQTEDAHPR
jgi:hypothetical protein